MCAGGWVTRAGHWALAVIVLSLSLLVLGSMGVIGG